MLDLSFNISDIKTTAKAGDNCVKETEYFPTDGKTRCNVNKTMLNINVII